MKLPIFHSEIKELTLMQTKWASTLEPVFNAQIVSGLLLSGVKLSNGTTIINHLLGRKLIGWFLVGINGAAQIYDNQENNQNPELTLSLTSNAVVTVKLWVF